MNLINMGSLDPRYFYYSPQLKNPKYPTAFKNYFGYLVQKSTNESWQLIFKNMKFWYVTLFICFNESNNYSNYYFY